MDMEALDMLNDEEIVEYLTTRGWVSEVIPNETRTATRRLVWSPWKAERDGRGVK